MLNFFKKQFNRKSMDSMDNQENSGTAIDKLQQYRRAVCMDRIDEHLFLGGSSAAESVQVLKELDIKYVLSVFDDHLNQTSKEITYMRIFAADHPSQDLITHFPETNKFIGYAIDSKQNVLVHCHAGISRSSTIVLAYIMNKNKMPFNEARALVASKRGIYPNDGFVTQLKHYEYMGFTLNANDPIMRQHIMQACLQLETFWRTDNKNTVDHYFERMAAVEGMTEHLDLGQKCVCVKCGQHLFNDIHIFRYVSRAKRVRQQGLEVMEDPDDNTEPEVSDERIVCHKSFIEPQKWMTEIRQPFPDMTDLFVKCPQCDERLVEFKDKFMVYWCGCLLHLGLSGKVLRFQISNDKFRIEAKV